MLREAEAKLRDYNLKHRSALQAALLITYHSGSEGGLCARNLLRKWFKGCNVQGALDLLESYAVTAKSCAFYKENNLEYVVAECADKLRRCRSKGTKQE
jgi:hypothetical protein